MGVAPRYLDYLEHFGTTVPVGELWGSDPGAAVVALRHDVDHDLDAALEMAWWERRRGCRSTYYLLHTAPYWDHDERLTDKALQLQDWGHEVGLHLNALTEWVEGRIDDVEERIRAVLERLRGAGVGVTGVSAHGDRACYEHQFANYWCWRDLRGEDPAARETGRSAEGVEVDDPDYRLTYPPSHALRRADGGELPLWQLSLERMGLAYDAAHVPSDRYFTDSGGGWRRSPDPLGEDLGTGRHQVLVHPEHWRAERPGIWLVLSTARSGSKWLAETLDRATPLAARHELTFNHRNRDGELVPEKRTAEGFAELARRPDELRALMLEARLWIDQQADDYLEANVYLAHALEQVDAVFPDARLIHLHRDPADVVRSLLERDWYDTPEDDRHPRVDVAGWDRMSPLERCCWYVRRVNESLLARDLPRLALEDVASGPARLAAALEQVDIPFYPRLAEPGFFERVNAGRSGRTDLWHPGDDSTLAAVCGGVGRRLGYKEGTVDRVLRRVRSLAGARRRRSRGGGEAAATVLLDERFEEPSAAITVVGATADWSPGGLVAVPDGDRHVQVLIGSRRWRAAGPDEGWESAIGGWYRAQLDPGSMADGAFRLFCLMYGADGELLAQRRLATVSGAEAVTASFAIRADAARFALALQAPQEALPAAIAVRRLRLERVGG